MNKHQYEQAHQTAEHNHNKVRDLIDNASHHLGRELIELSHRLAQDIKLQKNPRSLEDSVKKIVNTLQSIRNHGDEVMDFRHTDMFINNYQNLQMSLRKFENY